MRYEPEHVTQADGSESEWFNCWAAVGAWQVDGISGGRCKPSPTWFRHKAGRPPKTTGGLGDIITGISSIGGWDECKFISDMTAEWFKRRLRTKTGVLVAVATSFEVWPDGKNCQPNFDGYHMIGVVCGADELDRVKVMDPLCNRYRWVKVRDVTKAALHYNNEHFGQEKDTIDVVLAFPPRI